MYQIIEGLDNEVSIVLFFITLLLAIVIPLYFLKPNRNVNEETGERRSADINDAVTESPVSANPSSEPGPSSHSGSNDTGTENRPPDIGVSSEKIPETGDSVISVKVLYHETNRQMDVCRNMTLKDFKETCFPAEFAAGKCIRMIYSGKILQGDTYPLRYLGIMNGSVIHCVISDQNENNGRSNEPASIPNDLDISDYFLHLIGITLIGTWTIFITSANVMSATSITILGFLTVFFLGVTFYS